MATDLIHASSESPSPAEAATQASVADDQADREDAKQARDPYEALKLENQLCFPLYASAKEIVRRYKPFLDPLDLTYTQYITMMVMWEYRSLNVKELGEKLLLDSGTLTPVLKKLEAKGYVTRTRSHDDERSVIIGVTDKGMALRDQAKDIPAEMGACVKLDPDTALQLYRLLYQLLRNMEE